MAEIPPVPYHPPVENPPAAVAGGVDVAGTDVLVAVATAVAGELGSPPPLQKGEHTEFVVLINACSYGVYSVAALMAATITAATPADINSEMTVCQRFIRLTRVRPACAQTWRR